MTYTVSSHIITTYAYVVIYDNAKRTQFKFIVFVLVQIMRDLTLNNI